MSALDNIQVNSNDEDTGVNIVKNALSAPCATIAKNAGVDSTRVVEKVIQATNPSEGYDALTDQYVDMIQAGKNLKIIFCVIMLHVFYRNY